MRTILAALLLLACCPVLADEPVKSPGVEAYNRESAAQKQEEIARLQARFKSLVGNRRFAREMAEIRKRIAELSKKDAPFTPTIRTFEVGSAGQFDSGKVKVFQVLDDDEMLVEGFHYYDTLKRVGPTSFVPIPHVKKTMLLIRGVPTDKYADDALVELPGTFYIGSTYKYESLAGSNTVPVAEPLVLSSK